MIDKTDSGSAFELNDKFATTRSVFKSDTTCAGNSGGVAEGGLRTRGFIKRSAPGRPLISVVTVVYNAEAHMERAIQSVISQTYDNVEYIVVDGGSTDATLQIIKKYDSAIDYWISETDSGVYDAMNKGVKIATGDYVLFLGSDDTLFDIFHELADSLVEKTRSYYGSVVLSKDNQVYDGRFYAFKLFLQNIPHQAIFYSRAIFEEYAFDLKYIAVADYALNLKLFSDKRHGFRYIPFLIATYDNEIGLSSTVVDTAFSSDKPAIIKKHYSAFYNMIYLLVRSVLKKIKKSPAIF